MLVGGERGVDAGRWRGIDVRRWLGRCWVGLDDVE